MLVAVLLRARQVEDDYRLIVVAVGHVGDLAVQLDGAVFAAEVMRQSGLADVAPALVDPVDGALADGFVELREDLRLPWAWLEVLVCWLLLNRREVGLDAFPVLGVDLREHVRACRDAVLLCVCACVRDVRPCSSCRRAERAVLEWTAVVGVVAAVGLHAVVARLLVGAFALLEVRVVAEPCLDAVHLDGVVELRVALVVLLARLRSDFALVNGVFYEGRDVLE